MTTVYAHILAFNRSSSACVVSIVYDNIVIVFLMCKLTITLKKSIQNISGYTCNHGSLRIGNSTLRPLEGAMGTPSAGPVSEALMNKTTMNFTLAGVSL